MPESDEREFRIKYFPPNDFACGLKIEKIEQIYKNKDLQIIHDINDAIEFYNLYLYFHSIILGYVLYP